MEKTEAALWDAWRAGYLSEDNIQRFAKSKNAAEKDRYVAWVIRHLVDRAERFHEVAMERFSRKDRGPEKSDKGA